MGSTSESKSPEAALLKLRDRCKELLSGFWQPPDLGKTRALRTDIVTTLQHLGPPVRHLYEEMLSLPFIWEEGLQYEQGNVEEIPIVYTREVERAETLLGVAAELIAHGAEQGALTGGRGPKPRDHIKIAETALKYGSEWRQHIAEICDELDSETYSNPKGKILTFGRAFRKLDLHAIQKSIEYSLRKARRPCR